MKRKILVGTCVVLVALAACADLFEDPSQCKSDRDCTKFGGICDVTRSICVPAPIVPGNSEGGTASDAGDLPDGEVPPPPPPPGCDVLVKDTSEITGTPDAAGDSEITANLTLDCTKDWILKDRTFVRSGVTLTIQPGTRILALQNAALVVSRGAKLEAKGFRDQPIVFTASGTAPVAGFWRGLYLLGQAPPVGTYGGGGTTGTYAYGGTAAADSSGTLEFVRVEYGTDGLVLGGVGSGTKVDYVQVRRPGATQCFAIAGGRFNAKHLVCQYPGDEMFEITNNYDGKLQFLFGHKAAAQGGHHGVIVDSNAYPKIFNATICGEAQNNQSYGLLFRGTARFEISNGIFTGWGGGFDYFANAGVVPNNPLLLRTSIFADNNTNPAFVEVEGGAGETADDDNAFDEIELFGDAGSNSTNSAGLVACHDGANPQPWANATINGGTAPPNDGFFDSNANFFGAFKDSADPWMKGSWVTFAP